VSIEKQCPQARVDAMGKVFLQDKSVDLDPESMEDGDKQLIMRILKK